MKDWGFIGGTYRGYAPGLCAQRTVNLFPLTVSRKGEKTRRALVNVPGKRLFGTLPTRPGRGLFFQDGRCVAVAGDKYHEIFANGTSTPRGDVQDSGDPAVIVSNGQGGRQHMISSGGLAYIHNLDTNAFTPITDPQFPAGVITIGYIDGFFIAVSPTQFSISDSEDGLTWGADAGQRVGASEAVRGAIVDHEVLWLLGHLRTEPWFDSGAASFPFEPVPGTFIEGGLGAAYAIARLGDSIAWLLEDERGGRSVVRNQGYNPIPISHEGINAYLTALPSVADARMWAYQMLDHTFLVLTIPSQNVTLQFDTVENEWSELAYFNATTGQLEADRAACHCYAFGKHLVLDRFTGAIWELSMDVYADGDAPRQWERVSPNVNQENHMLFHQRAELDAVVGVGLNAGQGSDPLVDLRYSDDAGQTWGTPQTARLGAKGQYTERPQWFLLGGARNRNYKLSGNEPVQTVLNDLILDVVQGIH